MLKEGNETALRLLYYPPLGTPETGFTRNAARCDYGTFTLLAQVRSSTTIFKIIHWIIRDMEKIKKSRKLMRTNENPRTRKLVGWNGNLSKTFYTLRVFITCHIFATPPRIMIIRWQCRDELAWSLSTWHYCWIKRSTLLARTCQGVFFFFVLYIDDLLSIRSYDLVSRVLREKKIETD